MFVFSIYKKSLITIFLGSRYSHVFFKKNLLYFFCELFNIFCVIFLNLFFCYPFLVLVRIASCRHRLVNVYWNYFCKVFSDDGVCKGNVLMIFRLLVVVCVCWRVVHNNDGYTLECFILVVILIVWWRLIVVEWLIVLRWTIVCCLAMILSRITLWFCYNWVVWLLVQV